VSTAISCVLILVAAFFGVYFLHAVTAVYNHWLKETVSGMKLEWVLTRVQDSVNLAPMLSVLFIALRMRALQINPRTGSAQTWAMNCMVASTVFLLLKVFSMVVIPMCDVQSSKINGTGIGEVMFPYTKKYFEVSEAVVKHTCTCCIYGLALAIMAALFLLRSPDGPSMTPHVSPAMMCVTILCNLYFLAHISVYVAHTVTNIYPKMKMPHILMGVFDTGRKGVMYAPMLAILFLAARMLREPPSSLADGCVTMVAWLTPSLIHHRHCVTRRSLASLLFFWGTFSFPWVGITAAAAAAAAEISLCLLSLSLCILRCALRRCFISARHPSR